MKTLACVELAISLTLLLSQHALAAPAEKISNSLDMQLVLIPAGEFLMGGGETPESLAKAFPQFENVVKSVPDEYPQHRVRITRPFYLGVHEVTHAQFRKFVDATKYKTQAEQVEPGDPRGSGGWGFNSAEQKFEGRELKYNWKNPGFPIADDMPVVDVTWNDAKAFCDWLSKKEGKTYRLPTEAEWEYAARAGATTRYSSGDDPQSLSKIANTADADFFAKFPNYYPREKCLSTHDGQIFPAPVGSYPPNKFGLCDMHGNVWEWTGDWHSFDYYAKSPTDDPQGPATGKLKVRRGGAWHTVPLWSRVSFRNYNTPQSRYPNLGFRVVQVAQ